MDEFIEFEESVLASKHAKTPRLKFFEKKGKINFEKSQFDSMKEELS